MTEGDKERPLAAVAPELRRDFLLSMAGLTCVFIFVLGGLAHDANWRKFARISIAFMSYGAVLLALLAWRGGARRARPTRLPFLPFALAAAAAELSSGWLRPGASATLTFWLAPAACKCLWRRKRPSVRGRRLRGRPVRHRD